MATKTTKKSAAPKAAKAPAAPKPSKPALTLSVTPVEVHANFQFTVEVGGLDPIQSALLELWTPGGAVTTATVQASPEGVAQYLLLAREAGEHDLVVTAEGKHDAEETIDVLP